MTRKILLLCLLQCFVLGFSQKLRPVAQKISDYHAEKNTFQKYDLFDVNKSTQKLAEYKRAATDITVMNVKSAQLKRLVAEKPDYLEISFPFEGDKQITVELYKNQIFTNDFKVVTNKGEIVNYTPGAYYIGIVKGDDTSIAAFSFFNGDIVGVASTSELGNVVLGKAKNAEEFVSYSEAKLTGANPFVCGVDELKENQAKNISFNPATDKKAMTENCVRIYYEVCFKPYQNNNSDVTTTTNWLTAVHNNIATLYSNDEIKVALNEIFIWTTQDPYTGTPNNNLLSFRNNRQTFNGDLAHLINAPATTSVAYVNSLCGTYKHAYSGISQTYSNVPVYSWTIQAMTHEMGHSLGSPHTHACAWNGNNTAIDGCGAQAGYSEGCTGPIPSTTVKGSIMSYCHLISGVGISFNNGFGPQPAALIRNTVESKPCLGTNCTSACESTITQMNISNITQVSANAAFTDAVSASWKYKLTKTDGSLVQSGNTSAQALNFSNLQPATYYKLSVGTNCSGSNAYQRTQLFLTDGAWCDGTSFTDTGGQTAGYDNNETIVKTFYPSSGALTMNFTEFALEQDYDFMSIYNGPSTASPVFANGNNLTGSTIPGPFTSTHSSGAITVKFVSDPGVTDNGWKVNFSCNVLGVNDVTKNDNTITVYPNPAKNMIVISSKDVLRSYTIYDEAGRLVMSASSLKGNKQEVNVSSIQTGNYILTVETDKQTINKKFIKQ
ncbi:Por secretion system C-terminal sorting domain-containing protein [Chryseobacterium carnipullorum]|uniref:T9SS type A sorting domain-containing protein n=1 Tax=Chryseobacterium carnipullorum TaxID=1124835 RepID=UPI000919182F|nr:T9SS type A sorting domain-containing protein [Chryseobacterium carnipullorum]SHN02969.1 Por secretion system C-terminal sorting domain-containing protein [Chryseobacterium carnipullorum]